MRKINYILLLSSLFLMNQSNLLAHPYDDVPAGHWAYQAINELSEKGVISCVDTKHFSGNKPTDRFTMASWLAKGLAEIEVKYGKNPSALDKNSVNSIEKLSNEFSDELSLLAVKYNGIKDDLSVVKEDVANLKWDVAEIKEDIKKSSDKVLIGGDYLIRGTDLKYPHGNEGLHQAASLLRFKFVMNIDKDVMAVVRWRMMNGLGNSGTWRGDNHITGICDLAFLQLKNKLDGDILLGRTFEATGHSLLINQYVDVARYTTKKGDLTYQLNSYFNRKNGSDEYQIWNLNIKQNKKDCNYYIGLYGQHGPAGYSLTNKANDPTVTDSSRYDIELGSHGKLGKCDNFTYDVSAVFTKLKQDYVGGANNVDDNGKIGYLALNYGSKKEISGKVSYYIADKEAHGGLFLGGDRRLAYAPESPLEDITRLDNLMLVMNNFLINGDTHNFTDTKIQVEYKPKSRPKHYFRLAYDLLREQKDKVNGIDNYNPLGTDSGEADVFTAEYRYQISRNLKWKSGFTRFMYGGKLDKVNDLDAGHGKQNNTRDCDYNLFWTELYTKF